MNENKVITYSIDELETKVVPLLLEYLKAYRVLTFTGPLGAGKTTLIKSLAAQLGVKKEEITSPTFTYVNIYRLADGKRLYHFDLYRIASVDQFQEMGFDEYLFDLEGMVFIEWPEVIAPLLETHCAVSLDYDVDPEKRVIHIACSL